MEPDATANDITLGAGGVWFVGTPADERPARRRPSSSASIPRPTRSTGPSRRSTGATVSPRAPEALWSTGYLGGHIRGAARSDARNGEMRKLDIGIYGDLVTADDTAVYYVASIGNRVARVSTQTGMLTNSMTLATDASLAAGNVPPSPTDVAVGGGLSLDQRERRERPARRREASAGSRRDPRLPQRARGRLRRGRRVGRVRRRHGRARRPGDRRGRRADARRTAAARHRRRRGRRLGDAQLMSASFAGGAGGRVVGMPRAAGAGDRALGPARASTTTPSHADVVRPVSRARRAHAAAGKGSEEIARYLGEVRTKAFTRGESETADELFADRVVAWYALESPVASAARTPRRAARPRARSRPRRPRPPSASARRRRRRPRRRRRAARSPSGRRRSVAAATTTTASAPSELPAIATHARQRRRRGPARAGRPSPSNVPCTCIAAATPTASPV